MEIYLGKGVDKIVFGLDENGLKSIIGSPENIEIQEYGEDIAREYNYLTKNLCCTFSSEDQYRLSTIELNSKVYTLNGFSIVGSSLNDILGVLENEGLSKPTIDSISNEYESNHLMLYYNKESIIISLINYICYSFSIGPFWKNDDEILWPSDLNNLKV